MRTVVALRSAVVIVVAIVTLPCVRADGPVEGTYKRPPDAVVRLIEAPAVPGIDISPTGHAAMRLNARGMPGLEAVARPITVAGVQINPATFSYWDAAGISGLVRLSLTGGASVAVTLENGRDLMPIGFSPSGARYAVAVVAAQSTNLWVVDVESGQAFKMEGVVLNASTGAPCEWLHDSTHLLCRVVPLRSTTLSVSLRALKTTRPLVAENVRSEGKPSNERRDAPVTPEAEGPRLEYYFRSQLVEIDVSRQHGIRLIGRPELLLRTSPSTDDRYVLVETLHRPVDQSSAYTAATRTVEVWARNGDVVYRPGLVLGAGGIRVGDVPLGPRDFRWRPDRSGTLTWVEAIDNGAALSTADERDRLVSIDEPFDHVVDEIARTQYRVVEAKWTQQGQCVIREFDWKTRTDRWLSIGTHGKMILNVRNLEARYDDAGGPLTTGRTDVVQQVGDFVLFKGVRPAADGKRPFLDEYNLTNGVRKRLFESSGDVYDEPIGIVGGALTSLLVRHESRRESPIYLIYDLATSRYRAFGGGVGTTGEPRSFERRLLTYKRRDGLDLSATLYMPAGWTVCFRQARVALSQRACDDYTVAAGAVASALW